MTSSPLYWYVGGAQLLKLTLAPPPHIGRNLSLGRFPSSPAKKLLTRLFVGTTKSLSPSGKTNSPMVSADKWSSRSLATRWPTARGSSSSPAANPLCHSSSLEEIAATTTEKPDSSGSSPFIVPSAEQPVRGARPVVSRTTRNRECWSYTIEDR